MAERAGRSLRGQRGHHPSSTVGSSGGAPPAPGVPRLALTTSQVASRLGVSLGTVRRWADHGHLRSYRTPGGQRRFSAEDLEEFVASLERGGRAKR